jgi:hypothetical protein
MLDPGEAPLTEGQLKLLLPFVRDPGWAFAWGVPAGQFYENAEQRLGEHPPVFEADTAHWPCRPSVCTMLARMRTTEQEPRLRRLGLVTAFALDPRPWADSIRKDPTIVGMNRILSGIGATWPASSHPAMPPLGANWRAWSEWLDGAPLSADSGSRAPGTPPRLRFETSHLLAARMQELLTGRNLTEEWRQQEAAATTPVEHLVFESLLATRDAWHPDPDSVIAWLEEGSKMSRARGVAGANIQMRKATPSTDSTLITAMINRLLAHTLDGEVPWPTLTSTGGPQPIGSLLDNATRPDQGLAAQGAQTIYVQTSVVTAELRARWGSRVMFVTDMKWALSKDRYPASVVTIRGLYQNGRFVSVGADVFSARNGSQGIDAGEGGNGYLLVLTKDGWKIVSVSTWVV